jgi:hypothetical protein
MTDFPPPPGFSGYESRRYDEADPDERYVRACSEEEVAILEADAAAARAAERAEDEQLRDRWFALLRAECSEAEAQPCPSSTKSHAGAASGSPPLPGNRDTNGPGKEISEPFVGDPVR